MKPLFIYTDGSSAPHTTKKAGWSAVFLFDSKPMIFYGHIEPPSTNIVGEMLAVIIALELSRMSNKHTVVRTDSEFTKNCVYEWRRKWEMTGLPTKNRDLIIRLFKAFDQHKMPEIKWVKGHANVKWNEVADIYAKYGRDQTNMDGMSPIYNTRYFDSVDAINQFVQKMVTSYTSDVKS